MGKGLSSVPLLSTGKGRPEGDPPEFLYRWGGLLSFSKDGAMHERSLISGWFSMEWFCEMCSLLGLLI